MDKIPDTELGGKKRKASEVLEDLVSKISSIPAGKTITPSHYTHPAQAILRDDLLTMLPKKRKLPKQGSFDRKGWQKYDTDTGYNQAIDQMEQAIKDYFGEDA